MTKEDTYRKIRSFCEEYSAQKQPVRINFRELVPELNNCERYTHQIHSYPAKLLCNIPYFFLQSDYFCPDDGIVLDPFCGTGTVMLEANLSGRRAFGADANPLAVLIAQAKTKYIPIATLNQSLSSLMISARKINVDEYPKIDYSNIDRWFPKSTIDQLRQLELAIDRIKQEDQKRFFLLCFSNLIKKVSFADPSISVPVKLNPERFSDYPERKRAAEFKLETLKCVDVFEKFQDICELNIRRVDSIKHIGDKTTTIISNDARKLTTTYGGEELLEDESVDLILTSPPYAGAQKYIRSSWLNLYWLGRKTSEEIRDLKQKNIGREDYHKCDTDRHIVTGIEAADKVLEDLYAEGKNERACVVGTYLNEMKKALDESVRVLKKGGYMVIVIGNNTVCNRPFDTQDYLTTYLESTGMQLQFKLIDDIKSYGLMTKRNKTASTISCEWVLVFKKKYLDNGND